MEQTVTIKIKLKLKNPSGAYDGNVSAGFELYLSIHF